MTDPAIPDHVDLIVTHGGCHDGFTAEWLLHQRWPDAHCHPGEYGEDITPLLDRGIDAGWLERPSVLVMADFSYPLPEMERLAQAWGRIILLDHHASAIDRLAGRLPANVECVFDVARSGAGITADWLGMREPDRDAWADYSLVDFVEDRDLWRFALPESREAIQYLIAATPHTYEAWTDLNTRLTDDVDDFQQCVDQGLIVGRYHNLIVEELVEVARPAVIDGHEVLVTPSPYLCGSDVAGRLAELSPSGIGAYYRDLPDRREYGLRSGENGPNVAEVAEHFDGGGHPHASGFRTHWGTPLAPADLTIEEHILAVLRNAKAPLDVFQIAAAVNDRIPERATGHSVDRVIEGPGGLVSAGVVVPHVANPAPGEVSVVYEAVTL